MDEMLRKEDVLKELSAKIDRLEKRDTSADVILGLAAAMSTVKQMQTAPVNPFEKQESSYNSIKTELEHCEDAISRQAVLNLAKFDGRDGLGSIIHAFDVEQLPPVTPAEKMGHWEYNPLDMCFQCSQCKCRCEDDYKEPPRYKYCPQCGSKMQEVEE